MSEIYLRRMQGYNNLAVSLPKGPWIIGSAEADFQPWSGMWWIARVYVRPAYRAQGYGTQMMEELLRMLDEDGRPAHLIPNPYDESIDFDRLVGFYERHGFLANELGIMLRNRKRGAHAGNRCGLGVVA